MKRDHFGQLFYPLNHDYGRVGVIFHYMFWCFIIISIFHYMFWCFIIISKKTYNMICHPTRVFRVKYLIITWMGSTSFTRIYWSAEALQLLGVILITAFSKQWVGSLAACLPTPLKINECHPKKGTPFCSSGLLSDDGSLGRFIWWNRCL